MPIAVVGMSCRFPGDATSPERLWQLCAAAREAWSDWPADRFNHKAFYHPNPERGGTFNAQGGHFLKQDMGAFDASFFNITPTEAKALDPQQRLQLESTYEALENAGIPLETLFGSDTGVFIGTSNHDYEHMLWKDPDSLPLYHAVGVSSSIMANRISHFFDLQGPSVTIDTACSSSLVALHQACQSLRLGETQTAIVGGTNLILEPGMLIPMSSLNFFSPEGKCYTYDHRASGYGRGEGAGTVVLKPLDVAIRDGDNIRCVIRSTGVNSDGRTAGLMLPNGDAQEALIRSTYAAAGLDPGVTRYVESHGTGTKAGDPIESAAIGRVFGHISESISVPNVRVGSIKTNIGHLENASGIAGLIKTILSVEKGMILPNSNFEKAGDRVFLDEYHLTVPTHLEPWPLAGLRRASVNSFGFGGTNAHCVIDDAENHLRSKHLSGHFHTVLESPPAQANDENKNANITPRMFVLSANDEHSLKSLITSYAVHVGSLSQKTTAVYLDQLSYTLASRRSLLPWREAFVASSLSELSEKLCAGDGTLLRSSEPSGLGFVFTGQGAQWCRMGAELMEGYPVFSNTMMAAEKHLRSLGSRWSLTEELSRDKESSRLDEGSLSQPVCTAVQLALVDLLFSWGVKPRAVIGHSSGEIAAAYAVGALTLELAMSVAYYRGVAVTQLKDVAPYLRGAMLAVGLPAIEAQEVFADITSGEVAIACINSPSSVTVSGDEEAIDELAQLFTKRNVFARKLKVDVAYHSQHMFHVSNDYLAHLLQGPPLPGKSANDTDVIFASSLDARLVDPSELGVAYWVRNMVSAVQFSDGLASMVTGTPIDTLIEIGPHSTLSGPINQTLASLKLSSQIRYLPTLVRKEDARSSLLLTAGQLWKQGYSVNVNTANCLEHPELKYGPLADLPPYPFNHTVQHWHESRISKDYRFRKFGRHDLLGALVPESNSIEPRWRNILRLADVPWLKDHIVQSTVVFPAAGYITMAIEAQRQKLSVTQGTLTKIETVRLRHVCLSAALVIPSGDSGVEISLSLRPSPESDTESSAVWSEFRVLSHSEAQGWTEHCRGSIAMDLDNDVFDLEVEEDAYWPKKISCEFSDCVNSLPASDLYSAFDNMGLQFGPTFRNLDEVFLGSMDNSRSVITVPDTRSTMPHQTELFNLIHPAVLDSCFQSAFPSVIHPAKLRDPMVPTFIDKLVISSSVSRKVGSKLIAYASAEPFILRNRKSHIAVFDTAVPIGEPIITISGLKTTSLSWGSERAQLADTTRKMCYTMSWQPDVDLIDASWLFSAPDGARRLETAESLTLLEYLSFQYLREALEQISDEDRETLSKHHKRFYQWALSQEPPVMTTILEDKCMPISHPLLSQHDGPDKKQALEEMAECLGAEGEIVLRIGKNITSILKGELDPLALMIQGDLLTQVYAQDRSMLRCYDMLQEYASALSFKDPNMRILEIGAGTGGASQPFLESLGGGNTSSYPRFSHYTYTDISSAFFEKARTRLAAWEGMLEYRTLDIERDTAAQGFGEASYDLIIAANVLHATRDMDITLSNVRRMLRPGGRLIMIEITHPRLRIALPFGMLPGWWLGEDGRESGPLLQPSQWDAALKRNGFEGTNICEADYPGPHAMSSLIVSHASEEQGESPRLEVQVFSPVVGDSLSAELYQKLNEGKSWRPELCSWSDVKTKSAGTYIILDTHGDSLLGSLCQNKFEALKSLLCGAREVLWVTSGGQDRNPNAALVAGLARTLRNEFAGLKLVTLDLQSAGAQYISGAVEAVLRVFSLRFSAVSNSKDMELMERNGQIEIPRLLEYTELNEMLANDLADANKTPDLQPFHQADQPLRLRVGTPGLLDSLQFVGISDREEPLEDDGVEFKVKAIGLNFRDVLTALGQIENPYPLGYDSSGVVTAVGKSVKGFQKGDKVVALAVGSFTSLHRVKAHNVFHLPSGLSFEQGATIPLAYATAHYALVDVAKISKGHKILIHSAAGGVGQAAVQLAQLYEAEVFVTVGSEDKRQLMLDEYHIPSTHIFSSRNAGFAQKIMRMTDNQGVDMVLNSLAGELLKESWACVGMFGHFLDITKKDIYTNSRLEMRPFDKHVTFSGIDLSAIFTHRPQWGARILRDCFKLFDEGKIRVPMKPIVAFPIDEIQSAFRFMQGGRHSGKIVVTVPDYVRVPVVPREVKFLGADATYVIAGGAGGLGREICRWMVDNGARHIVLLSRSGTSSNPKVARLLEECAAKGAAVKACKCDTTSSEDVANTFRQAREEFSFPPIRGVINGAMVLDDSLFETMSFDSWRRVIDTKTSSSWNLHNQLLTVPHDFFILLSSASGISGNRGQSNYAASSTFQDALAHHRRALGLPAATLDLGMIESAGFVAENKDSVAYLRSHGYGMIKLEELFGMLRHAIITGESCDQEHCQVVSGYDATTAEHAAADSSSAVSLGIGLTDLKFSHLPRIHRSADSAHAKSSTKNAKSVSLRQKLPSAGADTRHAIITEAIVDRLASLLGRQPADISENKSVASLGVDSLVAVELRNWIAAETGVSLPVFEILGTRSLGELAGRIEVGCTFLRDGEGQGQE
ncbi:uncharacterized protein BCR38DRAFT_461375 [Pseudomassariella vexata]|uniref:Uncharacterized protein n=1 Tax=Pseudomassariella vexata TaxID=1141098 RepID=A0A1Y2DDA9_9PEZI|nr:uncharacterized protein BCR38DRAFT_461375 [Pseudomassariella vexata]ORY57229.1 hypothetical protein BCR38DRAFT_461375 [Pseudomassariella vexata]